MAAVNPPWALENLATHHANVNRMFMSAITGRGEGVIYGLAATQRGAGANMSVDVAKGSGIVFGTENEQQGTYGVTNDATTNVVISAADPTNPRIDLVVARVRDAFYSGATNAWALEAVSGTAAASPSDPTVPANSFVIARVAVAAAAASITNANITDVRPFIPVGTFPVNSARRPGVLYGPYDTAAAFAPTNAAGGSIYETDTHSLKYYTTATTGFQAPWNLPWGKLANIVSTTSSTTLGTAETDCGLTPMSAITIPANRIIVHHLLAHAVTVNLATVVRFKVTDGSNVQKGSNTEVLPGAINIGSFVHAMAFESGLAAGTYTRKWRVVANGGNNVQMFADANRVAWAWSEDIGPSTTPA